VIWKDCDISDKMEEYVDVGTDIEAR